MRDHQHGHAVQRKLAHNLQYLPDQLGVEGRGGLVKEHHSRVHCQRPGNAHALLLPAGELPGVVIGTVRQTHAVQLAQGFFGRGFVGQVFDPGQAQLDVPQGGQVVEEQKVLEDHADVLAHLVLIRAFGGNFQVIQPDLTLIGAGEQVNAAQKGAFAGAARTDDHDRVAFVDGQVKMLEDHILTIGLGQIFDGQDRFRHGVHSAG